MVSVVYLGPSSELIVGKSVYHPGDTINVSKAVLDTLMANGSHHEFEGHTLGDDTPPNPDAPGPDAVTPEYFLAPPVPDGVVGPNPDAPAHVLAALGFSKAEIAAAHAGVEEPADDAPADAPKTTPPAATITTGAAL